MGPRSLPPACAATRSAVAVTSPSCSTLGEMKRRLAEEEVRALEWSFEAENNLDVKSKARIAHDLHLHPHQVTVWFQNCRARWKTKQMEHDFAALCTSHDALRLRATSSAVTRTTPPLSFVHIR